MESDLLPTAGGIRGINLDNYFPNHRSYNTVVYYHKKFLNNTKDKNVTKKTTIIEKLIKPKSKQTKKFNAKQHKGQHQTETDYLNPVLEPTLRFTNNLIPLVIPSAKEISSPLIYTIKTSKKHKRCDKKSKVNSEKDLTFDKEEMQKCEPDKKRKNKHGHCESYSAKESIDPCSQNTLDDLNLNINQSCSFSESTDVKYKKGHSKCKNNNPQKYFVSSSFDAIATESIHCENNRIKIHLMNESDKAIFSESIKNPIINAIKDSLSQLTNNEYLININAELRTVQNTIQCNTKKLDEVLKKITSLENKISWNSDQTTNAEKSLKMRSARKVSKLEELSEDRIAAKDEISDEDSSKEEEYIAPKRRLRCAGKSVVVAINENYGKGEKKDKLGRGEEMPGLDVSSSMSQQAIKPDPPNRIPARFCWTDADRLK